MWSCSKLGPKAWVIAKLSPSQSHLHWVGYNISFKFYHRNYGRINFKSDRPIWTIFDRMRMDNHLWRKMTIKGKTFDWRQYSMEENIWWKKPFDVRQPLMEDDLWLKTTFNGWCILVEAYRWIKKTLLWRGTLIEKSLQWMMTFNGRQLSMDVVRHLLTKENI